MNIQGMALNGLSFDVPSGIDPFAIGFKLIILGALGVLGVYILPRIPYWFDEFIDRVIVIDFTEHFKQQVSRVMRWTVYVLVFYFAFYLLGFTEIHRNPFFQLVILFYGIKVAIALLKPFVSKLDEEISDIQVSEGSILMKILVIGVYLIGMFIALTIFGLRGALTTALAGAGVLGLVIGFGAKDLVSNTLSGIFIAIDQPFSIGDVIEVKEKVGKVTDMGLRTTEIEAFDNKLVVLPNTSLINNPVTNYTANAIRRISVKVGVDYDTNMENAFDTLEKSLKSIEQAYKKKGVDVLLDEFGDSAIVIKGRVWVNQEENSFVEAKSDIKKVIMDNFAEEGIEMPFPTRVIIQK